MLEINVLEIIKNEITRDRHPDARRNKTFYPSSAAVTLNTGEVIGGCWRADWYRIHNVPASNGSELYMHLIWELGKSIENKLVDAMKCAGIYESNSVKFFDEEHNVSGELDIVGRYRLNGHIRYYGVEVKSVYGIGATKTITGRARPWRGQPAFDPAPKTENLMQVMKYLWEFSKDGEQRYALDFFKMIYVPRDKPNDGREYTVTLVTKDEVSEDPNLKHCVDLMKTGEHYAKIETHGFDTTIETRFSVEDMHERWALQKSMFERGIIPPRQYEKFYSAEKIEALKETDSISKTAYENWEKAGKPAASLDKTPGHFLCQSYCSYRSFCYSATGKPRKEADMVGLVQVTEPK